MTFEELCAAIATGTLGESVGVTLAPQALNSKIARALDNLALQCARKQGARPAPHTASVPLLP